MPVCHKCQKFYPPDFVNNNICDFCKEGKDVLVTSDNIVYKREDVIDDYMDLLTRLKNSSRVQTLYHESLIREGLKNSE
jgi:hypothetical protein